MNKRVRLGATIVAVVVAATSAGGCDYYVTRMHGASYMGYPYFYYATRYAPERPTYVAPRAYGGGPAMDPHAPRPKGM